MARKRAANLPFVGYVRVSTGEQLASGLGLDAQRTAIRAACEARGWPLGTIYEDAASGGSVNRRPGLQQALDQLTEGAARGIIVAKLDRLSRSLADFANLMARANREGWAVVALDLGVDTTSPAGEMVMNVLASFAHYERRLIGARTAEALQELKAQGATLGRPRSITPEAWERVVELRELGHSYRDMADLLNREGVPTGQGGQWHATTIYRAFKSRQALER